MIYTLQIYRAMATILVVLYHSYLMMNNYYIDKSSVYNIFKFGHSGVELFFVLSGFIIYFIHRNDESHYLNTVLVFMKKRIVRIFPAYWVVLFTFLPIYFLFPSFGDEYYRTLTSVLHSILLFPQDNHYHVTVAWTLSHELLFYFIFSVSLFFRNNLFYIMFFWGLLIVTFNYLIPFNVESFYLNFLFSEYNLLFLFGVLSSYLSKNIKYKYFFIFGLLSYFIVSYLDNYILDKDDLIVLYGLSASVVLLNAHSDKLNLSLSKCRLLVVIGNASYSIYLLHYFIISFISKVIKYYSLQGYLFNEVIFIVFLLFSLFFGVLFHYVIELKLIKILNKK